MTIIVLTPKVSQPAVISTGDPDQTFTGDPSQGKLETYSIGTPSTEESR